MRLRRKSYGCTLDCSLLLSHRAEYGKTLHKKTWKGGYKEAQRRRLEKALSTDTCVICHKKERNDPRPISKTTGICNACASEASRKSRRGKAHAKAAEYNWKMRKIITEDGSFLTYQIFSNVRTFQGEGCAICHRNGFWNTLHADHDNKTSLFRGALCAECNRYAVGTFERTGHYRSKEHELILQAYLDNPPYQKWLRAVKAGEVKILEIDLNLENPKREADDFIELTKVVE